MDYAHTVHKRIKMVISWPDFIGKSNNLLTSWLLYMVWVGKPLDKRSWTMDCTPCTSPSW